MFGNSTVAHRFNSVIFVDDVHFGRLYLSFAIFFQSPVCSYAFYILYNAFELEILLFPCNLISFNFAYLFDHASDLGLIMGHLFG